MKKFALAALIVFAILSAAGNVYLGQRVMANEKEVQPLDQTQEIIRKVGELVELPEGVTPTVAVVDDPEILKEQGLFQKALKGDAVLIYPEEKKAILYRPSTNKVIEIAAVNITETPAPAPTPAPTRVPEATPDSTTPPAPALVP